MFALQKVSNFADYGFPNCYSYSKRQYENNEIKNPMDYLGKLPINEEKYTEIMVCIDPRNKKKNSRKKEKTPPPHSTKKTRSNRRRR